MFVVEKEVKDWLEQAQADLKSAKALLDTGNFYASVTYSQQTAEKALKAAYIFVKKKLPPKTHDLVELARIVNAPSPILAEGEKLVATYLTSRYPGTAPEIPVKYYNKEKAVAHLTEAEEILLWVRKKILL